MRDQRSVWTTYVFLRVQNDDINIEMWRLHLPVPFSGSTLEEGDVGINSSAIALFGSAR